jgi:hypothetical protein
MVELTINKLATNKQPQ